VNDLVAFGATVHTCSRTESELNKCLQEWQSQGFSVTGSVCDVSSRPQRESLIQQVASTFNGKLNIFVSTHCAKHINGSKKNMLVDRCLELRSTINRFFLIFVDS